MPFGIDSDELKKLQDPEDNPGTFASAKRASDEMPRLYGLTDALIEENAKLKAELASLRSEVAIARERLGPAGYKILTEVKALRAVVDATRKAIDDTPHLYRCVVDDKILCACWQKDVFATIKALDAEGDGFGGDE
jgi:hypothetical protein